ncbi:MAG: C40 family peptidase [Bacteroidota bacterium]
MVKQVLPAIVFAAFLSSCSALKSLNLASKKQVAPVSTPVLRTKFIEEITVTPPPAAVDKTELRAEPLITIASTPGSNIIETPAQKEEANEIAQLMANRNASNVEAASATQLKYSILLNTEVESLPNKTLLDNVDEWYGVRYRRGGNTRSGVDCSGFTVAVYAAVYGMTLPRVSREQYRISRKISTTELQEGDLVFFNTTGRGVSHVGVYLGNNRFIHASVSRGVMVNSLFDTYYIKRFIGAGRIDDKQMIASN